MEIKTKKLSENATIPTKAYSTDAGFDLYAAEDIVLWTLNPTKVKSDIAMEIPRGFYGRICDRSGKGIEGVHVVGGIIDAHYRGNITMGLVLVRASIEDGVLKPLSYPIKKGDRVAQIIISDCAFPELVEAVELTPSDRGEAGFGSTGR